MKFARRKSRRAIAGIVATVIMFAILFTVGTSYFIFVEAQNAAYVQSLVTATNKEQSSLQESLTITTLLETDGDVGFEATNPSALAVNITAALVLSSTGTLLKCDGVGFPSSAGCSNSTPTLWTVVNSGQTSSSIDTGYLYTSGTTVTVKVLTARGNAYSATYPAGADQSTSSQAVTVNLDNLKWVQLIPQASSLAHKFVSTCNNTSTCTVTDSSVTAGNILVDALGWGVQAPPSGLKPSDSDSSSWTLGEAASVQVPQTPALVKSNYESSCTGTAPVSCSLQMTGVGTGDALVYAAGWSNMAAPSAPTDTFGDTFTVGEEDQLTITPPTPALVQSVYNKNCGAATCGATTASDVNTGDILAFGLGWYGNQPYVPITVANCEAPVPFGVDGDNYNSGEGSTLSASLTTTHANDVIMVIAFGQNSNTGSYRTVSSVTDSAGALTFTERGSYEEQSNAGGYSSYSGIWYATASSTLSSDSIKVTWSSAPTLYGWIQVFGVSGANTSSPFDSHSGLPAYATSGNYASVSTSNANDFIYGLENTDTTSAPTVGTGFSALTSGVSASYVGAEYQVVSSTESSLSMSYSNAASDTDMAWGDALVKGSATCSSTSFISVDGTNYNSCGYSTSCTVTLTTANAHDLIYLTISDSSGGLSVSSVSDGAGLTWDLRQSQTSSSNGEDVFTYYAIAPSALSSDTISVTMSSRTTISLGVMGVSGADLAAPFDTNVSTAPTNTGTSSTATVTVPSSGNTATANDIIIGAVQNDASVSSGASGYTTLINSDAGMEYEVVSSTGSYTPTFSVSSPYHGNPAWGEIGDAIQAAPATSTPTTFQEMVTWDPDSYSSYEASNLGNIRFCTSNLCTTELYAWLESCTSSCSNTATSATAWVKLTSAISDGSSTTIDMVFQPTSATFDDNYWGEAPTLSSSYGQYDNGANVFNFYDNFAGSSLDSNWQTIQYGSGGSVTVNNGITLSETSSTSNYIMASKTTYSPAVEDASMALSSKQTASSTPTVFYATTLPTTSGGDYGFQTGYRFDWYQSTPYLRVLDDISGTFSAQSIVSYTLGSTSNIWSATWGATGSESLALNYVPQIVFANSGITYGSSYIGVAAAQGGQINLQWLRLRAVPPNGIMPTTTFGTLVSGNGSPSTPTDSFGDSFTTAANLSTYITVSGVNYYSEIWYSTATAAPGNEVDTISVTFPSSVVGSVSIYEITGYTTASLQTPTPSTSTGSTTTGTASFTPASNSFVIGNVETASSSSTFTAGTGYTLISTSGTSNCSSGGVYGCSEYQKGVANSPTTIPSTLGASTAWAEVGIAFPLATSNTYYSYIWYGTAGSSGTDSISTQFAASGAGPISVYAISGVSTTLYAESDCTSATSGCSSGPQVNPTISPASLGNSVVIGNTEGTASSTYTAGSGYTLTSTCSSVLGCAEYSLTITSSTSTPMSISPSVSWVESAVDFSASTTTYYSYIWYATPSTGGSDTVTINFGTGSSVSGGVDSLYEITGYTTSGAEGSQGSSSTGSTSATVNSFTPASDSFIVGNVEGVSSSTDFTAGSGFTLVATSGTPNCTSGLNGCSEYEASSTDGGSPSTVPMTLSSSTPWAEAAMSFSTPFNPQSGIQVGGYPTMGVPSGASIVWEVTFTNVDPEERSITLWPQSELAIGSAEYDGFDTDYTQAHYYLISSLNAGSTTVNAYSTSNFITLAYNVPTTLYFASTEALGSTTQAFGTNVLTPFEAYFALDGIMSDGTLFGETIPYPYGIITEANAYTTPTSGAPGQQVTVSCTSPCDFNDGYTGMVGWINSAGQLTQETTFTVSSSGNIPSGVTFDVPNVSNGYYTIEVTDYVNSVFMTFQVT